MFLCMSQLFPHWKRTVPSNYILETFSDPPVWLTPVDQLSRKDHRNLIDHWQSWFKSVAELFGALSYQWTLNNSIMGTHHCHHSQAFSTPEGANKGKLVNLILGMPFSEKKMFWGTRNRRKFLFIPSKFRLFRGTKNPRNSIQSQSTEG
jgi:hypothetical protein